MKTKTAPVAKLPLMIERKVASTTAWSGVVGVVIAVLNALSGSHVLDSLHVSSQLQGVILALIPMIVTALSGYITSHTDRPDVQAPVPLLRGEIDNPPSVGVTSPPESSLADSERSA